MCLLFPFPAFSGGSIWTLTYNRLDCRLHGLLLGSHGPGDAHFELLSSLWSSLEESTIRQIQIRKKSNWTLDYPSWCSVPRVPVGTLQDSPCDFASVLVVVIAAAFLSAAIVMSRSLNVPPYWELPPLSLPRPTTRNDCPASLVGPRCAAYR